MGVYSLILDRGRCMSVTIYRTDRTVLATVEDAATVKDALMYLLRSCIDLSRVDLSHANLPNAEFYGIDLSHANLSYTNLSGADLSHSNLSGANLSGANLSGADLSYAVLYRVNFAYADLSYVDLYRATLYNSDFYHTNLSGARGWGKKKLKENSPKRH